MDTTVKTCYTCNEAKPLTDFHRDGERLKPWCKPCRATARKNHSNGRIGKEAELRARLRARYGITLEEREEMRVAQDGKCAICLVAVDNLYVDHCHETGKVRGLLCNLCNVGLGSFGDKIENLERAMKYLG